MTTYNIVNPAGMVAGQPEDISIVLANLQTIAAIINGSLDDANLSPSAAIAASKLAGYPGDVAKVLKGDGTWAAIAATTSYGTALPATPTDGREHILVDSLTAPTYQWHFRYNAGATGPYKWEYVGGTPFFHAVDVTENMATVGPQDLATVGPQFTVPRDGEYFFEISARVNKTQNDDWYVANMFLQDNGVTISPIIEAMGNLYGVGAGKPAPFVSISSRGRASVIATHIIKAVYWLSSYSVGGGSFSWATRRLTVTPVRVG